MSSNLTHPVMVGGMDLRSMGLIPGAAEMHTVTRSTTTDASYQYWTQAIEDEGLRHTTLQAGHDACTSGRNDVVMLSCDSHTTAATITWSKNMTHLVGMYGMHVLNQRSRLGHSVTLDPLINVTGYGCSFTNLYTMYGAANATDLTCLKLTGNRNSFSHCHFLLQAAEPADVATFKMIHFTETGGGDGLEHYFNHTTISAEAIAMSDGEFLKTNGTPRLVFEDCLFIMRSDANAPRFLDGTAGDGQGFVIFKNCVLHNLGTELTAAFGVTGLAGGTDYIFAGDTTAGGVAEVIAAAHQAKMFVPAKVGVTEDASAGLSIPVDSD